MSPVRRRDFTFDGVIVTNAEFNVLFAECARQAGYWMMVLLTLPRVIVSEGSNRPAVAMFVWAALALIKASRKPRIPKAIVRLPRGQARARAR